MDVIKSIQLALYYYQNGDFGNAEYLCREILKRQPNNADVLHFLGVIYFQVQKYVLAIQYIEYSLKLNPGNSEAYYNLARSYQKIGENEKAINSYEKAIQFNPYLVDAYINLGNLYQENGQLEKAIISYQNATKLNPDFAGAYYNLGVALHEIERFEEAISAYKRAIQINPNYADAYHDLGYAFHEKGDFKKAIECYQRAIEINPGIYDAYNNIGRAYQMQNKIDDAIHFYRKAIDIEPDFAEAHCNLAMALLCKEDFKEGWLEYEWRWKLKGRKKYEFKKPSWDGSDISGKSILLYTEQGLGDAIQFIRFAPLISERGVSVIVQCQKELKSLFQCCKGVRQAVTYDETLPDFDVHCPLLSLPLILGITAQNIPLNIPYINVDQDIVKRWSEKLLLHSSRYKIGLIWSGNPKYNADRLRSFNLNTFTPLAVLKDVTFYSLQKGEAAKQAKDPPGEMHLIDYTDEVYDFSDTAAIIKNLDLIISVDTSVAHLAGALGKPVWVLLPFSPDWRWMLNREDSPWYPTMRLFRQTSHGDWESVVEKVLVELKNKLSFDQ